jgi:hypothetical protein
MLDTDTFLTTVYSLLDDRYQVEFARLRAHTVGRRPTLSDSAVRTLVVAQHWFGLSERALVRRLRRTWQALFPTPLRQSACNRRVRGLSSVLSALVPRLAHDLPAAAYAVLDGTRVPRERCRRARRQRLLAPAADCGKGGVDRRSYWGGKLLLAVTPQGAITGFVAGPASTEARWLADALLSGRARAPTAVWHGGLPPPKRRNGRAYVGPNGPLWPRLGVGVQRPAWGYLGDTGVTGAWWDGHWQADYRATVLTPQSYLPEDRGARRAHASLRQIVETVNGCVKQQLGLGALQARSRWGLRARRAGKLVAHNVGMLLNQRLGRPLLAGATLVL